MGLKGAIAGGKATAIILRKRAIENYYKCPNICKTCNKIIEVKGNQKIGAVKRKVFCDKSCAAIFNNRHFPKRHKVCSSCSKPFKKPTSKKNLCRPCSDKAKVYVDTVGSRTKKEMFVHRKNWQSARTAIRVHAYKLFTKNNKLICKVCGYDKHVEVCHKQSVSSFHGDTLIKDINVLTNLVALCPNHHWEYDNGLLQLP